MTFENPSPPTRTGVSAVAALVVACSVALAVWWGVRANRRQALEGELMPWATAPLPRPGDPVDDALADLGARVFESRCATCHAIRGESHLGPNLEGVTLRREPAWIRAMVMDPDSMVREDPVARALMAGYGVRMQVAGGMDGAATRAVLEFLRRIDGGGDSGG